MVGPEESSRFSEESANNPLAVRNDVHHDG